MSIKDAEIIIDKLKSELQKTDNPMEALQWAKSLQAFVTANAIHHDLKTKLKNL